VNSRTALPPRTLPVLYFAAAHAALTLAFAAVAYDPRGASGFFYHAWMLGIVHLVTLGWITASILGSLYIVAPVAMRFSIPARAADYVAFAMVVIGIVGMVGHFWLQSYAGMAWAAATVAAGILIVGVHVVVVIRKAALPLAIATHVVLAFVNVLGAAVMGVLIAFDKVFHFLPGYVIANVFAHAHLAAIGWASMMVVGVAYRLLPMVLPAQMPSGAGPWASAVLLETGVWGLFVTLIAQRAVVAVFGALVVAGFAVFLGQVVWMLRHRRPKPPGLRQPDPAVLHAGAAFCWLAIASVLGMWVAIAPSSETSLRIAAAYGVAGLVGFLAQLVVGMEGRLLPLFAWYWEYANSGYKGPVPSPHEMPHRGLQEIVFVLWLFGAPALAIGMAFNAVPFVAGGAWSLLAATVADSVNVANILGHAYRRPSR